MNHQHPAQPSVSRPILNNTRQPNPQTPDAVLGIIDWWFPRVRTVFGATLRSCVLYGSAALDDFCSGWSDVDIAVILERAPTEEESREIFFIHDLMQRLYLEEHKDSWPSGQAIEAFYAPDIIAQDSNAQASCIQAFGHTREWKICNPASPFDHLLLNYSSILLEGSPITFSAPPRSALARQTREDLTSVSGSDFSTSSAIWLAGMTAQLARSLAFWKDNLILSKSAALEHGMATYGSFSEAFSLALKVRKAGSAEAWRYKQELIHSFSSVASPLSRMLESHIRQSE
jgi:hypothetical protein